MTALEPPPAPATATARVADVCVELGIQRHQFYGPWKHVFTPYYGDGRRLVCREELAEAAQYADPERSRSAVLALRGRLGRLPRFRD